MTGNAGGNVVGAAGARDVVLGRIRAALERSPADPPPVPRGYRTAGEHPPGSEPVLRLFAERLRDYKAAVHTVRADRVRDAIAEALPRGGRILVPAGLPPEWTPPGAVVDAGFDAAALDGFDGVVTGCAAAAAETGTIALDGSPGQGRRALSLVPDRHVCVVRAEQVVQTVPELLARLDPTRPLTLVSGPSATSDIELQRVEGVHGPRTLIVILVS
ncbi:MAG TPA: LUD domain-containing protein [Micromonosporaceae bacterium]|nr:LUD domain-containing protein [Micromonosporaceae bacterium]